MTLSANRGFLTWAVRAEPARDYFAGYPWTSPFALRATILHRLIADELNGDDDPEKIAAYRAELEEIRNTPLGNAA